MKTKEDMIDEAGKLTSVEVDRLKFVITEIESIIAKPEINETSFAKIDNILSEILCFKDLYIKRIISALKRYYLFED